MACGQNGVFPVSVDDFKTFFENDFDFEVITNLQIEFMFELACTRLAACLLGSKSEKYAFLSLVAFFLYEKYGDGKTTSGSLVEAGVGIVTLESQDDLKKTYSIPEYILKSPVWSYFSKNKYGMDYIQFAYPCSVGNIFLVHGGSTIS